MSTMKPESAKAVSRLTLLFPHIIPLFIVQKLAAGFTVVTAGPQNDSWSPHRTYHCDIQDVATETIVRINGNLHHMQDLAGGSGFRRRTSGSSSSSSSAGNDDGGDLFSSLNDPADKSEKSQNVQDNSLVNEDFNYFSAYPIAEDVTTTTTNTQTTSIFNDPYYNQQYQSSIDPNDVESNKYYDVKPCNCKPWLINEAAATYCPAEFDKCSISVEWWGDHTWVNCYNEKVLTSYARYIWKYVVVVLAMLVVVFCCTRPGHNGIKYFLSFCFPKLNQWIIEERLRNELAQQTQRHSEMMENWRQRLREEGYVTGYRLKTKVFRSSMSVIGDKGDVANDYGDDKKLLEEREEEEKGAFAGHSNNYGDDLKNNASHHDDEEAAVEDQETSKDAAAETTTAAVTSEANSPSPQSQLLVDDDEENNILVGAEEEDNDEDIPQCSICLLAFEDGDRVAELKCIHQYHAECLSEWIKKKNKCPLCQEEGIAEEIRAFDDVTLEDSLRSSNNNDNSLRSHHFQGRNDNNDAMNLSNVSNDDDIDGLGDGEGGSVALEGQQQQQQLQQQDDEEGVMIEGERARGGKIGQTLHQFFRRKVRPVIMGVNGSDLVTL